LNRSDEKADRSTQDIRSGGLVHWPINYTAVFFRLKTKNAEMSVSKNASMKTIADGISPNIDSSKLTRLSVIAGSNKLTTNPIPARIINNIPTTRLAIFSIFIRVSPERIVIRAGLLRQGYAFAPPSGDQLKKFARSSSNRFSFKLITTS
jgi:hypothetical protein